MSSAVALFGRYARVLGVSWRARDELAPSTRTPLERQFLPAALEILETPSPALPRAILWTIVGALGATLAWSFLGRVDLVAVAPGIPRRRRRAARLAVSPAP
ncbi:MAG: hypothetical protein IT514_12970 [Burkholderiales bacterium]|nr:hypothetical protein [Burkholderiales bacterium]